MNPEKLHIRFGIFIAIGLIAYFLILKLIGLHENPWLRISNGAIVAYGIYSVIRIRRLIEGDKFDYYKGFKTGIFTGFLATLIFVGFMAIYMFHIDKEFPKLIMESWMKDYNQGPGILIFILLVEGFASTVVLTLAFMQKFKPSWNPKKNIQKA
ncbi:DUF4199 domain-containing protein [Robertkochia solimangrovi]|uniref:DUF4199 domain-containing protein n=1 Tax=Robertkochia solimangrovi TaxID=2213046 RepID=UPI00117BFE9A|nr:DUF4199 domain-containing protein [Robertkochia solimangrovi]TRZ45799.1 DUF4199 domain-containing protein [Robertkochia solimangrovi]